MSLSMPIMNATRTYDHQLFETLLHTPGAPDQVSHSNGIGDVAFQRSSGFFAHPPREDTTSLFPSARYSQPAVLMFATPSIQ
jgi:hypothetical protein